MVDAGAGSSRSQKQAKNRLAVILRVPVIQRVTAAREEDGDSPLEPRREGAAVDDAGYNLEASVRVDAEDDFGREHLLRYCARPPVALGRLVALPQTE